MPTRLVVRLHMRRSARAVAGNRPAAATSTRPSRWRLRLADEDDAAVIDVGSRRPGHQKAAQTLEEICRIIAGKGGCRIEADRAGASERRLVRGGAGRTVARAAAPVGAV